MPPENSRAEQLVSKPLFDREPNPVEVDAMVDLMTRSLTIRFCGLTAVTLVSVLQRTLREGVASERMTQLAWVLRDEIIGQHPELANLIDTGWAGIPRGRKN